jgi:hypothetical protein
MNRLTKRGKRVRALFIVAAIAAAIWWLTSGLWWTGEGWCVGTMGECVGL